MVRSHVLYPAELWVRGKGKLLYIVDDRKKQRLKDPFYFAYCQGVKLLSALLLKLGLLIATAPSCASAADFQIGPALNLEVYHRYAPEETSSARLGGALITTADIIKGWPQLEFAALYSTGVDSFANQDSVDESTYRARLGLGWNPLKLEFPYVGVRGGAQFSIVRGTYEQNFNTVSERIHASYWSAYFGIEGRLVPPSGFGIREQFTAFYDPFFKGWVFQFAIGLVL